ncbi:hypothetical protein C8Q76DRAFT_794516 [Earliella scabrosa]|nr:hypothetical protein C8Q76DRAFT_794516 [Earliella scabrosa]
MAHPPKDRTSTTGDPAVKEENRGGVAGLAPPLEATKELRTVEGEISGVQHDQTRTTRQDEVPLADGVAAETSRVDPEHDDGASRSLQGHGQSAPMDLDEYSPLEDSPSPAERIRRAPAMEGKRDRVDRRPEGGKEVAREMRMEDASEVVGANLETEPVTPKRPQKRRRKASVAEESDLPIVGEDEDTNGGPSERGPTKIGSARVISGTRVVTRAMTRNRVSSGTQTTQRSLAAFFNKSTQKVKVTPKTTEVLEHGAQQNDLGGRDTSNAVPTPSQQATGSGANPKATPQTALFTFTPRPMQQETTGLKLDLRRLDANWGNQQDGSQTGQKTRPVDGAPLHGPMEPVPTPAPTPTPTPTTHVHHNAGNAGLGMYDNGGGAAQTPMMGHPQSFGNSRSLLPARGTPNPVRLYLKGTAAKEDADIGDATLQFAGSQNHNGASTRPIVPTMVQGYGEAAAAYNMQPQRERHKGPGTLALLYPSTAAKEVSRDEYIAGLTKCPEQGWPLRVKDHPCGFARGVPQEVAQQIHMMPDDSSALILIWGWPRVGAPLPEIMASRLRIAITKFLGGESSFAINPPNVRWYENVKLNALNAPAAYIVAGLSPQAKSALIRQQVVSSREITFFVHPNKMDAPIFVARFHRFPNPDVARRAIFEFFRSEWMYQITIPHLLKAQAGQNASAPAAIFEQWTKTVRPIPAKIPTDAVTWAVNVYCEPPTRHPVAWLAWAEDVRRMQIPIPECDPYVAAFVGHIRCSGCHSADHYDSECLYALVEGWKGDIIGSVANAGGISLPPPPTSGGGNRGPEQRTVAKRGGRNGSGRATNVGDTSGVNQFSRGDIEQAPTGKRGGFGLYPSM